MKIELHMIQNFAPSCLNRDDTNSPKDCIFGGVRRARISSQCIKKATRDYWFREHDQQDLLGKRTAKLIEDLADSVALKLSADREAILSAAKALVGAHLVKKSKPNKKTGKLETSYMVFLSDQERAVLVDFLVSNWDSLKNDAGKAAKRGKTPEKDETETEDDEEKEEKTPLGRSIKRILKEKPLPEVGVSADIALFGRMLADYPTRNKDAACQVAHAISTHKVDMEMDFFTAVDDLKSDQEDPGAGMMGVIGFNSACFYRYAVLDFDELVKNLGGDRELARRTVEAFLRASAVALPTGKQNTFAAHSRPDLILAVLRNGSTPLSLANAFVKPARPTEQQDLTQASVDQLAQYWSKVATVFGDDSPVFFCGLTTPTETPAAWQDAASLDGLVKRVMAAIEGASS